MLKLSDIFDAFNEKSLLTLIHFPFFVEGFGKGVELTPTINDLKPEDVMTPQISAALKKLSVFYAAKAVKNSQKNLKGLIDKVIIEESGTYSDLATAINQSYNLQSRYRALRIARTELTGVISNGILETLRYEGYKECKWITNIDGRERDSHRAINGDVVKIGSNFMHVQGAYPGDPNMPPGERINCRCTLIGVGLPEFQFKSVQKQFLHVHGALEKRYVVQLRRYFLEQRDRILSRL